MAEAVAEPVAEAVAEPVAEAVAEPVAEAVAEPVAEAVAEGVTAEDLADAPGAEEPEIESAPAVPRPEPSTMEELLAEQDTDIRSFKHGDVVEGAIVRIDKDEILVDIGAKSEGVVCNRELYGRNAESSARSSPWATWSSSTCSSRSRTEGHAVLSLRRAGLERKWRSMQEQFETGVIIEAPVIDHNKGGLIVDCGIRGFVPISQIVDFPRRPQNEQPRDAAQEIAEKLQPYVGRRLRLKILEVNRKANRLILSEKVALYEERREKRDELFSSLQVGQKVTGNVRSIAPFGVFIDLGGIDGLVHKSELSWNKVNNPEAGYKVGDEVEAEVIDINHERGRISLSIRRLQPDPWHSTVADFKVGDDHRWHGHQDRQLRRLRPRSRRAGGPHPHQRAVAPARGPSGRRGPRGPDHSSSRSSRSTRTAIAWASASSRRRSRRLVRRPGRATAASGRSAAIDASQAVQEPEGGIDNTLAAAFAQVRQQIGRLGAAPSRLTAPTWRRWPPTRSSRRPSRSTRSPSVEPMRSRPNPSRSPRRCQSRSRP